LSPSSLVPAGVPLLDSHVHLWDIERNRYPWLEPDVPVTALLGDLAPIRRNYLLKDYLIDASRHTVVGLVHVQADYDPMDPVGETQWLHSELAAGGVPYAIVAATTLEDRNVASQLEAHRDYPNVCGVRQSLNWSPHPGLVGAPLPDRMNSRAWRSGFALLHQLDLSFDLQVYPDQLLDAAQLAADFPDTRIALEHLGMPAITSEEAIRTWRHGVRALARNENVVAKISGLGTLFRRWTSNAIRPFVNHILEGFGPERLMVGTNFPIESLHVSFDEFMAGVVQVLDELDADEQRRVLTATGSGFYRIELDNFEGSA